MIPSTPYKCTTLIALLIRLVSLQDECQVSLNTVESVEGFVSDINNGRWDVVLPVTSQLKLPRDKLENLYELVF